VSLHLSLSQADALAGAIVREQTNRRKSRMGNRARMNLSLLYRGCRSVGDGQGRDNPAFGGGLEVSCLESAGTKHPWCPTAQGT
jgi:hypothetical protein